MWYITFMFYIDDGAMTAHVKQIKPTIHNISHLVQFVDLSSGSNANHTMGGMAGTLDWPGFSTVSYSVGYRCMSLLTISIIRNIE